MTSGAGDGSLPPTDVAAGRREALRRLFEEHGGRVRSIALGFFGGDAAAADDVVQRVFLKLHAGLPGYRGDARVTTWLHRVVVNACLDDVRSRRRLVPLAAIDLVPAAAGPDEVADALERERRVRAAVAVLPEKLRIAVLLRHFADLSYEELADALGCSPGTVASRLNRGHAALALALSDLDLSRKERS